MPQTRFQTYLDVMVHLWPWEAIVASLRAHLQKGAPMTTSYAGAIRERLQEMRHPLLAEAFTLAATMENPPESLGRALYRIVDAIDDAEREAERIIAERAH